MYENALRIARSQLERYRQTVESCKLGKIEKIEVDNNIVLAIHNLERAIKGNMVYVDRFLRDSFGIETDFLSEEERCYFEHSLSKLSKLHDVAEELYAEARKLYDRLWKEN